MYSRSMIMSCLLFQLGVLAEEKKSLLELWEERRIQYEQCMDLQLFVRDTEQADAWMTKQEVCVCVCVCVCVRLCVCVCKCLF